MEDRSYCKLKPLGGEWSIRQGKKLTTDFQSIAKDKSVAKWCENTLFPARKSFSTSFYGHISARMLAEEVVRRGDYFGSWIEAGFPVPYDYYPLVPGYRTSAAYQEWLDEQPLTSLQSKQAFAVVDLIPLPLLG